MKGKILILTLCILSCRTSEDTVFTLYRNSTTNQKFRIHIATFDSKDGEKDASYNNENCQIARELFENQPGAKVKYWCEKGYYKD